MLLDLEYLINKYDLNIKGIVQIGAHYGQEYSLYQQLGIRNLLMFEPVPETFTVLKQNVGKDVRLENCALGSYNGDVEMFIETANQGQSSSILEPHIHLVQYPHIQFDNKIAVPIRMLDEFIIEAPLYNMLNIDVQGVELEVLKGASEFLHYVDYIICEVNRDEVYKGCAQVEDVDEFLTQYKFRRVETDWSGNSWGDAFYIKK